MKRVPLKRKTPMARGDSQLRRTPFRSTPTTWPPPRQRKPLPAKGRRGQAIEDQLDEITPELMRRSGGMCEIRVPGVCRREASDRCHRQRRTETNSTTVNVMMGCRQCHKWTEDPDHRETAHRHGLIVYSWEDPEEIPIIPWQFPA